MRQPMRKSCLWPAMSVHFQCAELAMSMREERALKPVHSARPDISATKV